MSRKKRTKSKCGKQEKSSKGKTPTKFRIGPITRNPFLNFLRDMRKAARAGMTITELAARGAELWRKMSQQQKKPYCELAKQATKTKRKKRKIRKRESERSFSTDSSVYEAPARSYCKSRKSTDSKRSRY